MKPPLLRLNVCTLSQQCDQMARLFFIIWLLTTTQICPKLIKFGKVRLKFYQTQNKHSKVCLGFLKFAQVTKFHRIWSYCMSVTFVCWNSEKGGRTFEDIWKPKSVAIEIYLRLQRDSNRLLQVLPLGDVHIISVLVFGLIPSYRQTVRPSNFEVIYFELKWIDRCL